MDAPHVNPNKAARKN